MGCAYTKNSKSKIETDVSDIWIGDKSRHDTSPQKMKILNYDTDITMRFKEQLETDPEMFILNNLLLSVMFFENYVKEMQPYATMYKSDDRKRKINNSLQRLLAEDKMCQILPDCILESVSKHVAYKPHHGKLKQIFQPISTKRMFLINDIVDVVPSDQTISEYSSLDKPSYIFKLIYSERKGFVKLIHVEDPLHKTVTPAHYTLSDEPVPSTSSQNDDYSAITNLRTPQPIEQDEGTTVRRTTLPNSCFRSKKQKYESEEGEEETNEEDTVTYIRYLSSAGYMKYFRKEVFQSIVTKTIGKIKGQSQWVPGKIFCTEEDEFEREVPWEIIPAIAIPWPVDHAYDFENKPWPSAKVIQQIQETNAVAIPTGFFTKIGTNAENEIEWEICFPKAEHILQCQMSHAQIRCYMLLLAIHKDFIEPVTKGQGLLPEHIRNHMFWEIQKEPDYIYWQNNLLANKMKNIIYELNERISSRHLQHFFINQRNMFENIPTKYLDYAHKIFHNFLELPIMHFISVIRNIRYLNPSEYYPSINYNHLIQILADTGDVSFKGQESLSKVTDQKNKKQNLSNGEEEEKPKKSIDSIDLSWTPNFGSSVRQEVNLLKLFINLFLKIANRSSQISESPQTILYCKQTQYLCEILRQLSRSSEEEVAKFYSQAKEIEERERIKMAKNKDNKPRLPTRTSIQVHQVVNGNQVNLHALNKAFNTKVTVKNQISQRPSGSNKIDRRKSNMSET